MVRICKSCLQSGRLDYQVIHPAFVSPSLLNRRVLPLYPYEATPQSTMVGGLLGALILPLLEPHASIALTTFIDSGSLTLPKTTCFPSSQLVTTVVMKNCDPLLSESVSARLELEWEETYVLGPALAIERKPGSVCLSLKFSSGNFSP